MFPARSHRARLFWRKALDPVTRTSFAVLTCAAGFLLTLWPLLETGSPWPCMKVVAYYFCIWGLLLLVNLVIGQRLPPARPSPKADEP